MNYQEIKSLNKEQFEALLQLSQTLNTAAYEESLIEQMLDWVLNIINAERTVFAKFDEVENILPNVLKIH
jgi:allophanate hydrolase subunit 1